MQQLYIPDVGNGQQQKELKQSMIAEYDMVNVERPSDILHDDQHRFYGATLTAFLEEIGVSWEAMLFCFLVKRGRTRQVLTGHGNKQVVDALLHVLNIEKDDEQIKQELARKK